jgi:PBP1b-binding outer membrane lipoprotein LpoB
MGRTKAVVSIALTALVLAGCGGGGSPGAKNENKGPATPSAETSPSPKGPSVQLTVPSR